MLAAVEWGVPIEMPGDVNPLPECRTPQSKGIAMEFSGQVWDFQSL